MNRDEINNLLDAVSILLTTIDNKMEPNYALHPFAKELDKLITQLVICRRALNEGHWNDPVRRQRARRHFDWIAKRLERLRKQKDGRYDSVVDPGQGPGSGTGC